jgi:hypothetical protein
VSGAAVSLARRCGRPIVRSFGGSDPGCEARRRLRQRTGRIEKPDRETIEAFDPPFPFVTVTIGYLSGGELIEKIRADPPLKHYWFKLNQSCCNAFV